MSLFYNILWLEDTETWYNAQIKSLKREFDKRRLILKSDLETKASDFINKIQKEASGERFNHYDLILVDYNLSDARYKGDDLIKEIRKIPLTVDILFYSSNDETAMRESLKTAVHNDEDFFEGTYLTSRSQYKSKLLKLVDKSIKRSNSIVELRGTLMDLTAEFDFIMKESVIALFDKLSDPDKKIVMDEIINAKNIAQEKSKNNFNAIDKAISKYNIEKIFSSIYYTMDQTDKYKILELIIDKTGYKFFKNKELSKYKDEVIEHRNNLAHKKIEFAPCYKFLIYYNKLIELKIQVCECKNHSDEHKYSLTKCEEIRQSLFDYWGEFQTMFNAIT